MEQEADENIIETDLDDIRNFVQIDNPYRQRPTMFEKTAGLNIKIQIFKNKKNSTKKKKKPPSRKNVERARIYVHSDVCKIGVYG